MISSSLWFLACIDRTDISSNFNLIESQNGKLWPIVSSQCIVPGLFARLRNQANPHRVSLIVPITKFKMPGYNDSNLAGPQMIDQTLDHSDLRLSPI